MGTIFGYFSFHQAIIVGSSTLSLTGTVAKILLWESDTGFSLT
ncbi:hypothetical protein yfred0001_33770 [Yersinia frederiksenii ATCC 33641]|nr:hypothetical protein yfred0001_33770 [Yersinia frederiksenii ATCC 33641]